MSKLPNWISRREIVNGLVRLLKEPPYDTPYCPGAWFERLPSEVQEPWLYRVYEDGLLSATFTCCVSSLLLCSLGSIL